MKTLLFSLFVFFISLEVYSQPYAGTEGKKIIPPKAAGCTPPNTSRTMEMNNVRMLVHTAGNLWHRYPQNFSLYEVPKNSGIMCLFTAALWLGGTDVASKHNSFYVTYCGAPSMNKLFHSRITLSICDCKPDGSTRARSCPCKRIWCCSLRSAR